MISILTTVKDGYEFLEECAKSIFLQHCHYAHISLEWEWWIGINGHGDSGGPALQEALRIQKVSGQRHRLHVVNMPDVEGRVAALNALCSKSKGDWIAILDCDDTWEQDKLLTQYVALQMVTDRRIDVIGTHCNYCGDMSGMPTLPSGWITTEMVEAGNPLINSSVMIRRELAVWEDRCGLEDYDLWMRLVRKGHALFNVPHPLVRHRIHKKSAFNGGKVQDIEGLRRFYSCGEPTVVTAYYPVQSKHRAEQYLQWITQFWPNVPCRLVLYTEPELVPVLEKILSSRKYTLVVGCPLRSLKAFTTLSYKAWVETRRLDKETGHSPELYGLWYEKKEFVRRTIETNPFSSDRFVWCDAGIGRYPEWIPRLQRFPLRALIPSDRMVLLQIDPLKEEDCVVDEWGIPGRFDAVCTFGGGILASGIEGWKRWSKAYDAMLIRYHLAGRFIGKDQNIMASLMVEDPSLGVIVPRPPILGPTQGWFYLLLFFSGHHLL
jgi:glycosyltransferase involved in cell wall biosynthesis